MKKSGFKNISIIGVGLIGGSLGLALKKKFRGGIKITGVGRHPEKLKTAKKLGAVDCFTTDFREGVKDADIAVIASPVDMIPLITRKIIAFVKPGCIITDAGSVKGSVINEIQKHPRLFFKGGKRTVSFVGSHPLAGSEKTGIKCAKHDLFRNAVVAVVPLTDRSLYSRKDVKVVSKMWASAGARVVLMNPADHDKCVSATSHLPHLISASLVEVISKFSSKDKRVAELLAGSFRDLTRISDSDPGLWASICSQNSSELSKSLGNFIVILNNVRKNLDSHKNLYNFFNRVKNSRWKLLRSSQKKKFLHH